MEGILWYVCVCMCVFSQISIIVLYQPKFNDKSQKTEIEEKEQLININITYVSGIILKNDKNVKKKNGKYSDNFIKEYKNPNSQ